MITVHGPGRNAGPVLPFTTAGVLRPWSNACPDHP
jgi:hypothetical protein